MNTLNKIFFIFYSFLAMFSANLAMADGPKVEKNTKASYSFCFASFGRLIKTNFDANNKISNTIGFAPSCIGAVKDRNWIKLTMTDQKGNTIDISWQPKVPGVVTNPNQKYHGAFNEPVDFNFFSKSLKVPSGTCILHTEKTEIRVLDLPEKIGDIFSLSFHLALGTFNNSYDCVEGSDTAFIDGEIKAPLLKVEEADQTFTPPICTLDKQLASQGLDCYFPFIVKDPAQPYQCGFIIFSSAAAKKGLHQYFMVNRPGGRGKPPYNSKISLDDNDIVSEYVSSTKYEKVNSKTGHIKFLNPAKDKSFHCEMEINAEFSHLKITSLKLSR